MTLEVNALQYVEQEDHWKDLVLPEGYRDIVQSMVEGYSRGPLNSRSQVQAGMDLVQGKGMFMKAMSHVRSVIADSL